MIKQNLHTHSIYCDGKDKIEDMVLSAIAKDFNVLGFSGHGYCNVDNYSMNYDEQASYIKDVLEMKEKYKDKINIFLGIEQDVLGDRFYNLDYVIGSVHFVPYKDEYLAVDESVEVTKKIVSYYGSFNEYAKKYYDEVKKLAYMQEVDIIGHVDLLMKFNEHESFIHFNDSDYLTLAFECIDELIRNNKIIEVNTGAIARGMRTNPYPHINLLEYIYEKGGKICLNSDCHNKDKLDCFYDESLQIIHKCGFRQIMILTENGFIECSL